MAIADKIKLSSIKTLKAKSIDEVDALLVEMQKLYAENPRYSANIEISWERMIGDDITKSHKIKFKMIQEFEKVIRAIRDNEENFVDYVFSASIKLTLVKKDKEAERALKEKELDFFPLLTDEHFKVEVQEFIREIDNLSLGDNFYDKNGDNICAAQKNNS